MNYYNEFDPGAAQWLRNLIDAKLLKQIQRAHKRDMERATKWVMLATKQRKKALHDVWHTDRGADVRGPLCRFVKH